jgi:CDP-diacylglycerol---glycerol-3-phosphate 3-phosphatidyltransferase
MCHPWLAAGVTAFILVSVVRELRPVLTGAASGDAADGFLGPNVRAWFRRRIGPIADFFLDAGISPNGVTALQLALSALCGATYAKGWIFTAGWLLLAAGTLDVVDGTMARTRGAPSRGGAFIDSVTDRYGEAAVFFGMAVYFRHDPALWIVLAAFFGAFMVSYARARAEALGAECKIGLMQRPERYVTLGAGSLATVVWSHLTCTPARGPLIASIALVAVLANLTAVQRVMRAYRELA